MTQVLFTFVHPDGTPLADTEFSVQLRKSGIDPQGDSLVVPQTYTFVTNAEGTALLELQPSSSVYTMVMLRDGDQCGGIRYKFYVPYSAEVVRAEDLYLAPAPNSEPWDETAIQKITQAVQDSKDNADHAEISADSAALSAASALDSKNAASGSAAGALVSQQAAGASANSAANSANTATTKAGEASTSAAAALASKDAAAVTANASAQSAAQALASKNAAAQSAAEALASKNTAVTSSTSATASAGTATTKAGAASASASTATTQAGIATTQAGIAKTEADRARTAADEASSKQPLNGNLTALSAQNGAADTLAFFTGPSAMTTTPLTTQGRVLMAQATAAAMRSTLELGEAAITGLVTSTNDNTPGRIPTVGYAGIGRQLSIRTLPNTPTNRHDVISRGLGMSVDLIATGDKPVGVQDGPMITLDFDGAQGMNVLFDWRTGSIYTYTDITPAPVKKWRMLYQEDNIVNTMANKGIIEYGSNNAGQFTLLADGTAIINAILRNSPAIGANAYSYVTVPLPRALVENGRECLAVSVVPTVDNDQYGAISSYLASSSTIDVVIRNGAVQQAFNIRAIIIGRWK